MLNLNIADQFGLSHDWVVNLGAGLAVMVVEIAVLLLFVNGAVRRAQERFERRKWERARTAILRNLFNRSRLVLQNSAWVFSWSREGLSAKNIRSFEGDQLVIRIGPLKTVARRQASDVASFRDEVGAYFSSAPPEWHSVFPDLMWSLSRISHACARIEREVDFDLLQSAFPDGIDLTMTKEEIHQLIVRDDNLVDTLKTTILELEELFNGIRHMINEVNEITELKDVKSALRQLDKAGYTRADNVPEGEFLESLIVAAPALFNRYHQQILAFRSALYEASPEAAM